jgi:DUF1680 family protein
VNFLTIQDFMEKLQAHEKRVNEIQEDMDAQTLFSKFLTKEKQDDSRYIQGGRGRGKTEEDEDKTDLKEKTETASTDQSVDRLKLTSRLDSQTLAIQDLGLTK